MKRLICILALCVFATNTLAAPSKTAKKPVRKSAPAKKVAPKKAAPPKPAPKSAARPAPPSFATRPSDYYSQQAHQRAVNLVKEAALAYERGDYKRAIALCDAANDAYPTYARTHTWMGASYQKLGDYEKAARAYRWAMSLAPGTADAQRAERGLREIGY
jgi:tetratricopeptide (TPR) repeat protein